MGLGFIIRALSRQQKHHLRNPSDFLRPTPLLEPFLTPVRTPVLGWNQDTTPSIPDLDRDVTLTPLLGWNQDAVPTHSIFSDVNRNLSPALNKTQSVLINPLGRILNPQVRPLYPDSGHVCPDLIDLGPDLTDLGLQSRILEGWPLFSSVPGVLPEVRSGSFSTGRFASRGVCYLLSMSIHASWFLKRRDKGVKIKNRKQLFSNILTPHNLRHPDFVDPEISGVDYSQSNIDALIAELDDGAGIFQEMLLKWRDFDGRSWDDFYRNWIYTYEKHKNNVHLDDRKIYFEHAMQMYNHLMGLMVLPREHWDATKMEEEKLPHFLIGESHALGTVYSANQFWQAIPFAGHALLCPLSCLDHGTMLLETVGIHHDSNFSPVAGNKLFFQNAPKDVLLRDLKILWPRPFDFS